MATLAISDDMLLEVGRLAAAEAVPVDRQVEVLLKEALQNRQERQMLLARLDAIAAMTPKGLDQTDSALLLREDRER